MTVRKLFALAGVNLLVLLGLLALLEAGFRLATETYSDHRQFRLTQPAPYQDAPYFSKEFVIESFAQPGGWETPPGTNLLIPNDFKGKFFTIEGGVRRTTDAPRGAFKTIYFFGGSTAYSSEVPDEYTIASYLQRKLTENRFSDYRVINLGATSVSTSQQVERLKATHISKNDIVIFYDGVNDVIQGVMYGNAGGTIVSGDKGRPLWQRTLAKLAKHSALFRYVLTDMSANYRIVELESRISATTARYAENIAKAQEVVHKHGATFFHFLQPNIYTLATQGTYEAALQQSGPIPPQAKTAFVATYPHLMAFVESRSKVGLADFDLTAAFDNLDKPVYLDFCHVNHLGNEAIAQVIFSALANHGAL